MQQNRAEQCHACHSFLQVQKKIPAISCRNDRPSGLSEEAYFFSRLLTAVTMESAFWSGVID
ncbi:hypothetical protein BN871_JS_00040 [Paenibacillus sp. P22]|nr:hypothetical protein BN871_JS_00040 [Paenibacillus sp. P22]